MGKDGEVAQQKSLRKKLSSVASGAASGVVVSLTLQPLDVIRTRLQASAIAEGSITTNGFVAARKIWESGGIKSFWSGSGPTVWRLSIGLGLQFLTLETLREKLLGGEKTELTGTEAFLCGGIARTVAAAVTVPFTIAKTRLEYLDASRLPTRQGTFNALKTIVRTDGYKGLVRGVGPTILTNAPFSALYYLFYTRLRKALASDVQPGAILNFAAGTIAAASATLLTQPTDMIRTHMQLGTSLPSKMGMFAVLQAVIQKRGPSALLAGAGPRILKRTLQTALVWTLYEELQPRLLQRAENLQQTFFK